MNKNKRIVVTSVIVCIFLLIIIGLYLLRDFLFNYPRTIHCSDGDRITINISDFIHQYSQYLFSFEVSLGNKAKFAGKLEPKQLQELSESMQQTVEFRKWLVASYNACAISKEQFNLIGIRFQSMDIVAHRIDQIVTSPNISQNEKNILDSLVTHYIYLSREATSKEVR